MDDIHPILDRMDEKGKKVMATILEVEGSSYKKVGSTMLFLENNVQIGMLSPGCLEEDLARRCETVWESGRAMTFDYDLRSESDEGWGRGYGCNGVLHLLLEPVDEQLSEDLRQLKHFLDANIPVLLYKKIETEIEYLFLPEEGEPFGWWQGEIPQQEDDEGKSGMVAGTSLFKQFFVPKPRLFVCGAGPDARPLVALAAKSGFSVTVSDWREALCSKEYFPQADQLIVKSTREWLRKFTFYPNDLIVIMTHAFQIDQIILKKVIRENVKYIGVLGPRERTKRLLGCEDIPDMIHSPIGVPIGAIGAEEIAVSIVAQLIEVNRKLVREEYFWHILE